MTPKIDDALLVEYAPRGILRCTLNYGNPVLVGRSPDGAPFGISVSIARALAVHLGLELHFVEYDRAADVSSDADKDKWDVCFLAFDPKRAGMIDFTRPYLKIEGSYLVGPAIKVCGAEELVAFGAPIGAVEGSAYTLALQRKPGSENLVIFDDFAGLLKALDDGIVAAIAGIHAVMREQADMRPGTRVLHPPFMEIHQAIGVPKGRQHAKAELENWLVKFSRSGILGEILKEHGFARECLIA